LSSKLPPYTPPSPFIPFLRRFTDERARDLSDTIALYNEVRHAYHASGWSCDDAIERVNAFIADSVTKIVDLPQYLPFAKALDRAVSKRSLRLKQRSSLSRKSIGTSRYSLSRSRSTFADFSGHNNIFSPTMIASATFSRPPSAICSAG